MMNGRKNCLDRIREIESKFDELWEINGIFFKLFVQFTGLTGYPCRVTLYLFELECRCVLLLLSKR